MNANTLRCAALLLTCSCLATAEKPVPLPPPDVADAGNAVALASMASGTLPRVLDLSTAIALARACNPQARLAQERIVEQQENYREVWAGRGPQLALSGASDAMDDDLIESFGPDMDAATESWHGGLTVTQPLYQGGSQAARESGQRLRSTAAEESARTAVYDAMMATAEAFFGALLARDRIGVQEEAIRLHEEQLNIASNLFAAGAGPRFDVLQADVATRNARPPLLRARNDYRLAVEELRRAIGLPFPDGVSAADLQLAGDWPHPSVAFSRAEALVAAQAHRPELASLAIQRQAAEYDVRAARGVRNVQIVSTGGYGWRSKQFGDGFSDTLDGWNVGVQASIPLFSSGLYRARERQAESRVRQFEVQEDGARQQVEVEVSRSYADWQLALEILTTADAVILQAEEAVRLARNRFSAGAIPQLDVLQAALGLTRARLEKAESAHDYNLAVARLNRAMGIFVIGERLRDPATP